MSLSVDGFQKRQARRLTPELWEYNRNSSKDDILIQQISEKHNKDNRNRFVVFTRFVEKEARAIGELLKESGFSEYNGMTTDSEKTFKVITGNNGYELSEYSRISNLPTVLILTYQIAEQGVNLPGYNHVVNYHISAFPSALEQRFGRIDRMGKNGSQYPKINMCFLISKDYCWDTNTFNFYCAVNTYLHNLISYLPSKNTILSTKIIRKYSETRDYVKKYIKHILQLLDTSEQMNFIYDYFCHMADDKVEDKSSIECMCDKELFQLIDENGIDIDITLDKDNAIKKLRGEIKDLLAEFGKEIGNNENYSVEKYENLFKQILDNDSEAVSDKIFYSDDENYVNIKTIDAIEECAQIIAEPGSKFDVFREKFNDEVRLPNIVTKYLVRINKYFEQKFINNDFNSLFPYGGYSNIFKDILLDLPDGEDKALLVNNSDVIVKILPIFKMFSMYGDILKKLVYTQNNGIMEKFYFNQFNAAFYGLLKKVRMDIGHFGLSNEFCERYFTNDDWWRPDLYTIIPPRNSEDTAQASNWYKLAYHYTRKEEACFIKKSEYYWDNWDYCTDSDNNLYRRKEELIKYLATNFEKYKSAYALWNEEWEQYNSAYKTAMDGENSDFDPHELLKEMGFCGEPEKAEIIDEYENAERELEEVLKRIDAESSLHQSLFNYFIFTDAGNRRIHSMKIIASDNWKVKSSDWWTQGILNEVYGCNYKVTLGQIVTLPKQFNNISYY
jgi:hypothetical protein